MVSILISLSIWLLFEMGRSEMAEFILTQSQLKTTLWRDFSLFPQLNLENSE